MIRFDGQDYDETQFSSIAMYHLHRGFEIKRATEKTTRDLQKSIEEMSIAQVTLESLSVLGKHSEDVIRKELEGIEPVASRELEPLDVPGT